MHITVCMALLVCVLCQPVHSCIETSLHQLDFFLEIFFYGDLSNYCCKKLLQLPLCKDLLALYKFWTLNGQIKVGHYHCMIRKCLLIIGVAKGGPERACAHPLLD